MNDQIHLVDMERATSVLSRFLSHRSLLSPMSRSTSTAHHISVYFRPSDNENIQAATAKFYSQIDLTQYYTAGLGIRDFTHHMNCSSHPVVKEKRQTAARFPSLVDVTSNLDMRDIANQTNDHLHSNGNEKEPVVAGLHSQVGVISYRDPSPNL